MTDLNYLKDYYKDYDEDSRLTSNAGMVEFMTTIHYIERYLTHGVNICEIGAGTGRYSHYFSDKGYAVDAVELLECNIEIFKKKMNDSNKLTITQGNALDLSFINDDAYDITLLLGPMYHLYSEDDKIKVLSEALRITKLNGIIIVAYCISDSAIVQHGFIKNKIHDLIEKNMIDMDTFVTKSEPIDIFELVRKEDIDRLNSNFNVERLHYVSTDLFTHYIRETVESMDDNTFKVYMDYHLAICEREDMHGVTNHSLDVLRKVSR